MDSAVVRYFDGHATRYDGRFKTFIGERELRVIRGLVPARSAVLDFGCGTGRTTLDLLRRSCRVTGFDPSPAMLAIAERRARDENLGGEFVSDVAALAGRRWPVVTCIGVLDYYPDPLALLSRLVRHLAPGGRLVLTVPNALSPWGWLYAARGRLTLPVTLRSSRWVGRVAARVGLEVAALRYAFPSGTPLGLTLVAALTPTLEGGGGRGGGEDARRGRTPASPEVTPGVA